MRERKRERARERVCMRIIYISKYIYRYIHITRFLYTVHNRIEVSKQCTRRFGFLTSAVWCFVVYTLYTPHLYRLWVVINYYVYCLQCVRVVQNQETMNSVESFKRHTEWKSQTYAQAQVGASAGQISTPVPPRPARFAAGPPPPGGAVLPASHPTSRLCWWCCRLGNQDPVRKFWQLEKYYSYFLVDIRIIPH